MKILEVIESKRWLNTKTLETASIYGAVPYAMGSGEAVNWIVEVRGYTWKLDNGTVGLGRQPAKTREDALAVMEKFNNRDSI